MSLLLEERPSKEARDPRDVTVRVVADGGGNGGRRRRGPGLGSVLAAVVIFGLGLFALIAVGLLTGLLHLGNPFSTQTTDRTPPVVLKRLESLSSYRGASANFEVNVDIEKSHRWIPSVIAGSRTQFLGVGHVDAVVDFGRLTERRVVQAGGDSIVIDLPRARALRAVVDPDASHVVTRSRGIADRVGSLFTASPTSDAPLYRAAAAKMDAAAAKSGVIARAQANTTKMLRKLLAGLGYAHVTVHYGPAGAPTA